MTLITARPLMQGRDLALPLQSSTAKCRSRPWLIRVRIESKLVQLNRHLKQPSKCVESLVRGGTVARKTYKWSAGTGRQSDGVTHVYIIRTSYKEVVAVLTVKSVLLLCPD